MISPSNIKLTNLFDIYTSRRRLKLISLVVWGYEQNKFWCGGHSLIASSWWSMDPMISPSNIKKTNLLDTYIVRRKLMLMNLVDEDMNKTHLGVAGTPLFPADSDSPTLSIHVPAFHWFPPNTNPVSSQTPADTLKPASFMLRSKLSPAPLSRNWIPIKWRCITSWMTSYNGMSWK